MKTFSVFGIPPGYEYETLLIGKHFGEDITDINIAKHWCKILERDKGCTELRICVTDWSKPLINDFINAINI